VGATIGRYLVLAEVGRGARGTVVSALDPELDRKVALEVLHAAARGGDRGRLQREAQALARLSHPNVMVVHDVGTWTDSAGGPHVFLAMELVEGERLSDWLAGGRRSALSILDAFVQAGRGLAAAHAAGLVHGDFSPHNVLVGADGRVRVTDFGRASMAPEHLEGHPAEPPADPAANPAADQLAFCVALHEALQGRSTGTSLARGVPRAVARALARGLAADPEARHRSMDDLLDALQRRSSWIWRVVPATVVALAGLGLYGALAPTHDWCEGVADRLDEVWGPSRRRKVEARFAAIAAPYAQDVWSSVATELDRRTEAWGVAQREACVQQATEPAVAARRMACLHRRLESMRSFTDLLLEADAAIVEHALEGLEGIGTVDECDRARGGPMAHDAAGEEARLELTSELSRIDVYGDLGRFRDAVDAARSARARAVTLGDRWLEAEAVYGLARALEDDGRPDEAEQAYHDAFAVALAAGHDEVVARAAMSVAVLVSQSERTQDARRWIEHAEGAVERLGEGAGRLAPQLENARGRVAHLAGDFEASREAFERALRLREATLVGDDHSALASYLVNLGHALAELGRLEESAATMERAADLEERRYGPDHPRLATTLAALCGTLSELDRTDEAITHCARAREIFQGTVGESHPRMGTTLTNLGNAYGRAGRYSEAIEAYEAARRNAEAAYGPDDGRTALVLNNLGVLHELQGEHEAALDYHGRSLEIMARVLGEDHPRTAVARMNFGSALGKLERWAEAEPVVRRALATLEETRGDDHPDVALALGMLAETYLKRDRPAEAVPLLERAREVIARADGKARQAAQTDFALGAALWESGLDRERGMELVQAARAAFVALAEAGADEVIDVDSWLADSTSAP
jgi:tetratricopeptide (TPR) repeat protein